MNDSLSPEAIAQEAVVLANKYSQPDLMRLLEFEWNDAETRAYPTRAARDNLRQFLERTLEEIKARLRINQDVLPAVATAIAGEVISQLATQHPDLVPYRIPIAIMVAILVKSVQASWINQSPNSEKTPNK